MTDNRFIWSWSGWKLSIHVPYLIFVCCALILCLFLSSWQWQRAMSANQRYADFQQQSSQAAIALPDTPQNYQRVTISGELRNHFFLDNQIYQGEAGWYVLAEVQTNNSLLLVNLGWQPKQDQLLLQQALPEEIKVQGLLKQPQVGFMLATAEQDPNWPQLLQQIQIPLLNEHFAYELSPFVLYSETPVTNLIPAPTTMENKYPMHLGYAIQWLLIAVVGFAWFIYICRQEQKENETH